MKNYILILVLISVLVLIFVFLFYFKSNFSKNSFLDNFYNKYKFRFKNYDSNKSFDVVDQVYCIVMPDRKEYMINQMNKLGINCKFLDAITPKDLSKNDYNSLSKHKRYTTEKKTRLPLQLSFTMCYLDAIKNNYDTIIVFEDDLTIETKKENIIIGINEFKNHNSVMFYMGYCWLNCNQTFKIDGNIAIVQDYSRMFCCHSICYKVKYLPELIDFLYPMDNEFDVKITKFFENYNYNVCIPRQIYFDQNKELGTHNETLGSTSGVIDKVQPFCVI